MKFSITWILSAVFLAYISHSLWVIYTIFYPTPCQEGEYCLKSYLAKKPKLELKIFTSLKEFKVSEKDLNLVWHYKNFSLHEKVEMSFNVSVPLKACKNGTLYVHAFIYQSGENVMYSSTATHTAAKITMFMIPQATVINLLGDGEKTMAQKNVTARDKPVTHWRSRLTVSVMEDLIAFDRQKIPAEIYRYLRIIHGYYLPIIYIDELGFRNRDLLPLNTSVKEMPLTITYTPISIGKLRMWTNMLESFKLLQQLGFTEKDMDEIKGIFADTNFYFLMLTFTVAAFHLLFDFLAFKNDISYWRNRDTMVGLSTRAVLWRCVSTIVIFLYLMDEETSLLVLIPAGVGTIIEMWKVTKALKLEIHFQGLRPHFRFGSRSEKELETQSFDTQAMKYLSYVLYPLCLGGAVYSLLYVQHKSWYSWCVQSMVNGVYAFGFLFMLPQLFVNYKLKSVAHLPWRAFMYKAFNTFIDDVFAFIITMPTAHRLACFRDDVVFLIYLYQRWLYPVDKTRVNEYGMSFEDGTTEKDVKKIECKNSTESKKEK